MKNTFSHLHSVAKLILIIGALLSVSAVIASSVFHFGAGKIFDYYSACTLSESLLAASRPIGVLACCGALGAEYRMKQKDCEK